jgi:hypothetical protein
VNLAILAPFCTKGTQDDKTLCKLAVYLVDLPVLSPFCTKSTQDNKTFCKLNVYLSSLVPFLHN